MKLILIVLYSFFNQANWMQFSPETNDYTIVIRDITRHLHMGLEGGYLDTYTTTKTLKSPKADYVLMLKKFDAKEEIQFEDLKTEGYENVVLEDCKCKIIRKEEKKYGSHLAMEFKIKKDKFLGYSINIPHKNYLYTFMFLTEENNLTKFQPEFDRIINSFKINEP